VQLMIDSVPKRNVSAAQAFRIRWASRKVAAAGSRDAGPRVYPRTTGQSFDMPATWTADTDCGAARCVVVWLGSFAKAIVRQLDRAT